MKSRQWKVHLIADCQDCNWSNTDFIDGRSKAAEHAKRTGHRVTGEEGFAFVYERQPPQTTGDTT